MKFRKVCTTKLNKFTSVPDNHPSISKRRILSFKCICCGFERTAFGVADALAMARAKPIPDDAYPE
jgi:hypothetical protein